jgi:membrane-associated phospholipid phosphatase
MVRTRSPGRATPTSTGDGARAAAPSQAIIRDSALKWRFLAGIGVVDAAWIGLSDFELVPASIRDPAIAAIMLIAAAAFSRYVRRSAELFVLLDAIAQIIVGFAVGGILSYLVLSTNHPLIDRELSAIDYAIGFDWPHFVGWVQAHPLLDAALQMVYRTSVVQMLVLAVILAWRQEMRVRELSGTILIALTLTILLSGPFAAAGAYPFYGPEHPELVRELQLHDFFPLREGSLRVLDLARMEGLISFPSFHTVLSLLFVYITRRTRTLLVASILLNGAILVSTLTAGGHYLVDVLGGALVTALSIALYRAIGASEPRATPAPTQRLEHAPSMAAPL